MLAHIRQFGLKGKELVKNLSENKTLEAIVIFSFILLILLLWIFYKDVFLGLTIAWSLIASLVFLALIFLLLFYFLSHNFFLFIFSKNISQKITPMLTKLSSSRFIKDLLVALAILTGISIPIVSWLFLRYLSLFVYLLVAAGVAIFISYRKDVSTPLIGTALKREYFRIKFKLTEWENKKNNFFIFFLRIYSKALYYFVILFKNSRESFDIIREELQLSNGNKIAVLDEESREMVDILKVREKLQKGETVNPHLLQKLYLKLFELHKKAQKRIALFSLAGLSAIVSITVITSLITSFIFPTIFQSKAASYGWLQTAWDSLSGNNANHSSNQFGWNEYASIDAGLTASSSIQLAATSGSIIHTSDADFSGGTFSSTAVSGTDDAAKVVIAGVSFGSFSQAANIDVGFYSTPTLADLDGDGDLDMYVGGRNDPVSPAHGVWAYENTGSASSFIFTRKAEWDVAMPANGWGGTAEYDTYPVLGDLDGDGDYDMLSGSGYPGVNIYGFKNNGTVNSPSFVREATWDFQDSSGGGDWYRAPNLGDLDGDGDLDIMLGTVSDGTAAGYENTGNASSPTFVRKADWDITCPNHRIDPALYDLDGDNDLDIICAGYEASSPANPEFAAYENTGNASSPTFVRKPTWDGPDRAAGLRAIDINDLNNDGVADLIEGNDDGTIWISYSSSSSGSYQSASIDLGQVSKLRTFDFTLDSINYQSLVESISDLVYYWKLDGNFNDSEGGNNATSNGATADGEAKYGSGSAVVGNYFTAPAGSIWNMSYEMWVKPNAYDGIIAEYGNGSGWGNKLKIEADGRVSWFTMYGGGQYIYSTTTLLPRQWYHIVAANGPEGMKLYINGQLEASFEWHTTWSSGNIFQFGGFDGLIDEVAVYRRVLTAEEVASHYEDVKFQLAANNDNATWDYIGPDGGTSTYYTATGAAIAGLDGNRYVRYKAYLATAGNHTPSLDDVTIDYVSYYPTEEKTLISSPYNSTNFANVINQIAWTENLPANTDIKFQIRTAPDDNGSPGAWSSWLGQAASNATVTAVGMGYYHSTVLKSDGTVWTWGGGSRGTLGNGANDNSLTPVQVSALSDVTAMSANTRHVLAVKQDGTVWAWGYNGNGQLGDGTTNNSNVPLQVPGLSGITAVATGDDFSIALKSDGTVWTWGGNGRGQLGDGSTTDNYIPAQVNGLTGVIAISAGYYHSIALKSDGTVWTWGANNSGQLGDGTNDDSLSPVQVSELTGVTAIDSEPDSSIALKSDGTVWTWGDNGNGKLGDGTTNDSNVPLQVPSLSGVSAVIIAYTHSLALKSDGTVWAWGENSNGDLGDGTNDNSLSPVQVSGLTGVTAIDASEGTSIALKSDGSVWTWGDNYNGQLGDGTTNNSNVPVQSNLAGNNNYYTDSSGGETINSEFTDGLNDQWMQYKVILSSSDGVNTPTLSDVTITYGNATPEVQSVTASQAADGNVSVAYEVRDKNTATGVTPNALNITLQYCTANCSSSGTWANATAVTGDVGAGVSVVADSFTSHSLIWNPNTDYDEQSNGTDFKVRVKANDGETVVNLGYGESGVFTLDTTTPVISSAKLQATTTPASLVFGVADDFGISMKISLNADLSGAEWQTYNATSSIALATDPDNVYVQFKDAYGNTTAIQTLTTPETPTNMVIRDLSNPETETYQEFLAWKVVNEPNPGFAKYNVYYSTDGSNYSLLSTVNPRSKNYYFHDTGLSADTHYYYKIATEDASGNESYLSSVLDDIVDGQGGTDTTPPRITSVTVTATSTQSATIAWTTDELSNSTVGYSTEAGNFTTESGSASMVTSHSVTLTSLTPNTTYYFRVKSSDPNDNEAISNNGGDGYTLTTVAGPVISAPGPTTIDVKNTGATITWNTDIVSDSYIVYSANSDLSASTEVGYAESVTAHTVTLTSLTAGTKYYYYVHSGVAQDTNGGDYYTFTTSSDLVAPNISGVTAASISDTSAIIQWATNEKADELVEYGLVSGTYTASTTLNSTLNLNHSVVLSGLTENTRYYYRVTSADGSGNSTTSSESNFTTRESLSTETEVVARETSAREEGVVTGRSSVSGGGVFTSKAQTDAVPPEFSNIKVSDITATGATVTWSTNEIADSFIEYGVTQGYGDVAGKYETTLNHQVSLRNLNPNTTYNFRVAGKDILGNLSRGSNQSFKTLVLGDSVPAQDTSGQGAGTGQQTESQENVFVNTAKKTAEVLDSLASKVSLGILETALFSQYNSLEKAAERIPPPEFTFGPRIKTSPSSANIYWETNKEANSLVAFAPENVYEIAANKENAYTQLIGNPDESTLKHEITIYDLKPDTSYHYQLRSKAAIGSLGKSRDFVFRTEKEALEIVTHAVENFSTEKAVFRWITNTETDSVIKYIPYRNNVLAVDEVRSKENKLMTTIHELELSDLEGGVTYQIEMSGTDANNALVTRVIPTFSTSEDDLPPLIYQVQAESAISPGKDSKIQTIISWMTNEPATSRVYFQKGFGVAEDMAEKTAMDNNYSKRHVAVITKFEPGSIYTFRVESIDSGGNTSISKTYTILAPRQKDTVFQIIMKNLEQTFGWVGQVGL